MSYYIAEQVRELRSESFEQRFRIKDVESEISILNKLIDGIILTNLFHAAEIKKLKDEISELKKNLPNTMTNDSDL